MSQPAPAVAWSISASSDDALRGAAAELHRSATARPDLDPTWLAATPVGAGAHRAVIVGSTVDELVDGLSALAAGRPARNLTRAGPTTPGRVVFVFPGQGTQWPAMGQQLYAASPEFRAVIDACADAMSAHVDWSLHDVLTTSDPAPFERTDVVQPALFAMMVGLATMWRAHGVVPDAVVGHSQGEIAAAHVAGALTLSDAVRIVALRSRVLAELADPGAMVSISLPAPELTARIAPWGGHINVAVENSPASTVVAGSAAALAELEESLAGQDVTVRKVRVDYASHCPAVDALRERLLHDLAGVTPRRAGTPMYSTVTGGVLSDTSVLDAEYWFDNLRRTVLFERTTRALHADGFGTFVEVSPHPVLAPAIANTLPAQAATVVSTLRRNEGDHRRFLTAAAKAHTHGVDVDWSAGRPGRDGGRATPRPSWSHPAG